MKRYCYSITLLAVITIPMLCFSKNTLSSWSKLPIDEGIQRIEQKTLGKKADKAHIGIIIQSMNTGKILYENNANQLFTPASVQKLLTASAALYYLKPGFQFATQLLTQGKISHHTLKGDLIIRFTGDPELTSNDLSKLFQQLKKKSIRQITGHVYIDSTAYGNVPYPPGWIWDDLTYSFAAPLRTIIINHNYFILKMLTPGAKKNKPLLETNLPDGAAQFTNELRITKKPKQRCPIRIYSFCDNHYVLRGCYYHRWKRQTRKIAIRDMSKFTKILVRNLLIQNKVHFQSGIEYKAAPKNTQLIAQHLSPPINKVIKEMLKESDNLTTNAVFKKLGETYFHQRGTWQNSLHALKKILSKPTGIDFKKNLINDGAGLSRYNLLSPKQLSKLLYFIYKTKRVHQPLIKALPIAGKDGTMEYRLRDQATGSRIRAKTGTMTGVTALAGYIKTKHSGTLSFVIMINGFVKPRKPYIVFENDICRYLVSARKIG